MNPTWGAGSILRGSSFPRAPNLTKTEESSSKMCTVSRMAHQQLIFMAFPQEDMSWSAELPYVMLNIL
ncbi:hypothetical protein AV530_013106 [Patagioenas fasciata monilis]|uniref:Uncharacterized protein n=1 Tax=Patagioenas fasciata monilis TaxID=372326 RepID=A0A1V4J9W2_PATFA|nr:hypothetical protein AV530_013106 [Patagioenas fasciata monilis]